MFARCKPGCHNQNWAGSPTVKDSGRYSLANADELLLRLVGRVDLSSSPDALSRKEKQPWQGYHHLGGSGVSLAMVIAARPGDRERWNRQGNGGCRGVGSDDPPLPRFEDAHLGSS